MIRLADKDHKGYVTWIPFYELITGVVYKIK